MHSCAQPWHVLPTAARAHTAQRRCPRLLTSGARASAPRPPRAPRPCRSGAPWRRPCVRPRSPAPRQAAASRRDRSGTLARGLQGGAKVYCRVKERRRDRLGRGKTSPREGSRREGAAPHCAGTEPLEGAGRHTPRKTRCGAGVGRRVAEAAVIGAAVVGDDRALPRRRDARAVAQQQPAEEIKGDPSRSGGSSGVGQQRPRPQATLCP